MLGRRSTARSGNCSTLIAVNDRAPFALAELHLDHLLQVPVFILAEADRCFTGGNMATVFQIGNDALRLSHIVTPGIAFRPGIVHYLDHDYWIFGVLKFVRVWVYLSRRFQRGFCKRL